MIPHPFLALLCFSAFLCNTDSHKQHPLHCFYLLLTFTFLTHVIMDCPPTFPKKQLLLKPQKPLHPKMQWPFSHQHTISPSSCLDHDFFLSFFFLEITIYFKKKNAFWTPHSLKDCLLISKMLLPSSINKHLLKYQSSTEVGLGLSSFLYYLSPWSSTFLWW